MNCACALLALLFSLYAFCEEPVMFRGNPQHSGIYQAAGVPNFTKLAWKFHTAGRVISSPAVANAPSTWAAPTRTFTLSRPVAD